MRREFAFRFVSRGVLASLILAGSLASSVWGQDTRAQYKRAAEAFRPDSFGSSSAERGKRGNTRAEERRERRRKRQEVSSSPTVRPSTPRPARADMKAEVEESVSPKAEEAVSTSSPPVQAKEPARETETPASKTKNAPEMEKKAPAKEKKGAKPEASAPKPSSGPSPKKAVVREAKAGATPSPAEAGDMKSGKKVQEGDAGAAKKVKPEVKEGPRRPAEVMEKAKEAQAKGESPEKAAERIAGELGEPSEDLKKALRETADEGESAPETEVSWWRRFWQALLRWLGVGEE